MKRSLVVSFRVDVCDLANVLQWALAAGALDRQPALSHLIELALEPCLMALRRGSAAIEHPSLAWELLLKHGLAQRQAALQSEQMLPPFIPLDQSLDEIIRARLADKSELELDIAAMNDINYGRTEKEGETE